MAGASAESVGLTSVKAGRDADYGLLDYGLPLERITGLRPALRADYRITACAVLERITGLRHIALTAIR